MESEHSSPTSAQPKSRLKLIVLAVVAVVIIGGYLLFRDKLTLDALAASFDSVSGYKETHPVLVYGGAFLLYVVVTGLSLPGAAPLTLLYGWFLGFVPGVILVSFASTAGATIAFLLSRYLFRDWIQQRFGDRLATFNRALEREGSFYLFTLRLIPAVPFFVINVVMGLTPIPTRTFWWVSQVGMLAGTCVFVFAGANFPDLATLQEKGLSGILTPNVIIAFVILGIFPFVVKKLFARFRPATVGEGASTSAPSVPEAASDSAADQPERS